jgi:O-antigen/teichoic acid export membrane protein
MISKKFLKSSFLYTITGALPIAAPILLLPFYTDNLSDAQFGYLGYYIGISQLIQIVVTFSFDQVIASHYFEYKEDFKKLSIYLSSVFVMILLIGIGVVLVLSIFGPILFNSIYSSSAMKFYPFGMISVFTGIFNSILKVITNLYIAQQKPEKYASTNILNFILIIVFSISGLYLFPQSLVGPMFGRLIAGSISFIILLYSIIKLYGFQFDYQFLKSSLSFNRALFIVPIVSWFILNIDRYIIGYLMNDSDVGTFTFAVGITNVLEVVMGALLSAVLAPIYNIWSKDRTAERSSPEVNRFYNVITSISIILIGLSIVCLPIILPLVIRNKQYYTSFEYMPMLCLSYITMALWHMYSSPLMFDKRGFIFTKILVGSAIFKLLSGLILIYLFGLYGAVWSVLLTKIFHHGWIAYDSNKIYHQKYNKIKIILLPLLYTIFVVVSNQVLPDRYEIFYHLVGLLIFGLIIFFVFKNEIVIVLKKYGLKF